jgi:hypothetical protein
MPETSSRLSTRFRQKRLGRAKTAAAGEGGGAGRAFHRIVEVVEHFAPRAVERRRGEIDSADNHRQHIVEVVGDAAGQLPDRFPSSEPGGAALQPLRALRLRPSALRWPPSVRGSARNRLLEPFRTLGFRIRQLLGVENWRMA